MNVKAAILLDFIAMMWTHLFDVKGMPKILVFSTNIIQFYLI